MKLFIAVIALTLAVASQASYIPEVASYPSWPVSSTSVWPSNGIYAQGAYNAWPQTTAASWNAQPYVNSWSASAWSPAASIYNNGLYGHKTVVQANVAKAAYPWGQPWGTYGAGAPVYGLGYNGGYLSSVPVSNQIAVTSGSYHVAPVSVGGHQLIVA
ncbi:uncharacterized protein LOC135705753 [Ochlerotatus camptorhynchus]|uniref:uncharacterized protein LOC135705753 n=1 Tax=Ochlerotatus camptorhynchus TaxID=644619 RepID=UPI0031DFE47F